MIRGIERRKIFLGDTDRIDFLKRLDRLLPEEGWRCFAWALMPNHVHMVIQSPRGGLSRLMARLNTGYARSFNTRHDRVGYVFQNRFKSRVVEDETDLIGLVVYVIRNPLTSNLVKSPRALERYRWCNLGSLVGLRPSRTFEASDACLSLFADDREAARTRIRERVVDYDVDLAPEFSAPKPSPGLPGAGAPAISTPPPTESPLRAQEDGDPALTLANIVKQFAKCTEIPEGAIMSPGRHGSVSDIRALIAALAVDEIGLRRNHVAKFFGISDSAVSKAAKRGRAIKRNSADPLENLRDHH